jgi:hypothetical protein
VDIDFWHLTIKSAPSLSTFVSLSRLDGISKLENQAGIPYRSSRTMAPMYIIAKCEAGTLKDDLAHAHDFREKSSEWAFSHTQIRCGLKVITFRKK